MKKYTIDSAIKRLQEIADLLENPDSDLATSMKLYEEGVKLISFCNKTLTEARQKIASLSEDEGNEEK